MMNTKERPRIPFVDDALRSMQISRDEAEEMRRQQAETMRRVEVVERRVEETARRLDELVTGERRPNPADIRSNPFLGGDCVRGDQPPHA